MTDTLLFGLAMGERGTGLPYEVTAQGGATVETSLGKDSGMGTYSFNVDGNDWATFQPNLASVPTQFGVGFWFETQNAGGNGDIVRIRDSSGTQIVRIYRADDLTAFYRNTNFDFYVPELHGNVWKSHMGIDVKLGASGWIAVYLNGVLVVSVQRHDQRQRLGVYRLWNERRLWTWRAILRRPGRFRARWRGNVGGA